MVSLPSGRSKFFVFLSPAESISGGDFDDTTGSVVYFLDDTGVKSYAGNRPGFANTLTGLQTARGYLLQATKPFTLTPTKFVGFPDSAPIAPATTTGNFRDDFTATTLNPAWQWINESPSDWSLTADPGKLRLRRYQGHGFYRTPQTESGQTPVPVLWREVYLNDGFQVEARLGFYNTTAFGQMGILLFQDLDNYVKMPIEFDIQQALNIVMLKEVNGVDPRDAANLHSIPWTATSVDVRLKLQSGNWVGQVKLPNDTVWTDFFTTTANLSPGRIKLGLYAESDQPSQGSAEFAYCDFIEVTGSTPVAPPAATVYDFTDSFATTIGSGWLRQNDKAGAFVIANGRLQTPRESGDIFQGNNSAIPVLYRSGVSFTNGFEAVVDVGFIETNLTTGQGGIIIYDNFDNYVRFFLEFASGAPSITILKEVAGVAQLATADVKAQPYSTFSASLQIQIVGGQIRTQYKQLDALTWTTHFTTTLPTLTAPRVGLFSLDFQDTAAKSMYFDNFKLKAGS